MPFLLIAAASFACASPTHHDGDAIRCAGMGKSMRLHGIDAPEMPGACRPGRECTPGDPYAARDTLAALTRGRVVECRQVDTDHYGRRVVDCTADGENLGCAMIAAGMAVERYGRLDCGRRERRSVAAAAAAPGRRPAAIAAVPAEPRYFAPADAPAIAPDGPPLVDSIAATLAGPDAPRLLVIAWLAFINAAALAAMASDKRRAGAARRRHARHQGVRRIPEAQLLLLAALGGSGGAIAAQQLFRHKTLKQPFAGRLRGIAIAQLVLIVGVAIWVRRGA